MCLVNKINTELNKRTAEEGEEGAREKKRTKIIVSTLEDWKQSRSMAKVVNENVDVQQWRLLLSFFFSLSPPPPPLFFVFIGGVWEAKKIDGLQMGGSKFDSKVLASSSPLFFHRFLHFLRFTWCVLIIFFPFSFVNILFGWI